MYESVYEVIGYVVIVYELIGYEIVYEVTEYEVVCDSPIQRKKQKINVYETEPNNSHLSQIIKITKDLNKGKNYNFLYL